MTDPTPDHVPCRHCGDLISWDEVCWTHDSTGFADCGLIIGGGTKMSSGRFSVTMDPELTQDPDYKGKMAEPIGEWK